LDLAQTSRLGTEVLSIPLAGPSITGLGAGHDHYFALADDVGTVRLWGTETLWATLAAGVVPDLALAVALDRDTQHLAIARLDGTIELCDLSAQAPDSVRRRRLGLTGVRTVSLAFRPGGRELAIGGEDGSISLVDLADDVCRLVIRAHKRRVNGLSF